VFSVEAVIAGKPIDHVRRRFALLTAGAAVLPLVTTASAALADERIKAIVFDAFPIFDPRSVFATAEALYPGKGQALSQIWFQKIFTDTWLRTSARQYLPFGDVAAECLDYVCRALAIPLAANARDQIVAAFSELEVWPDVTDQLKRLRARGVRLAVLSNMSEAMLRANMRRNGLDRFFEAVLSTDTVQAFKPAPEAYALAMRALGLRKQEIGFAAFAAWDAAGAGWFGYPTAWVNRQGQQSEPGAPIVRTGGDLSVVGQLLPKLG
jgi:2-haloacid dehalogenase